MSDGIIIALIGGCFTIVVALIEATRRQNNKDHASNANKLDKINDKIDTIGSRIGDHLEWHAHKD